MTCDYVGIHDYILVRVCSEFGCPRYYRLVGRQKVVGKLWCLLIESLQSTQLPNAAGATTTLLPPRRASQWLHLESYGRWVGTWSCSACCSSFCQTKLVVHSGKLWQNTFAKPESRCYCYLCSSLLVLHSGGGRGAACAARRSKSRRSRKEVNKLRILLLINACFAFGSNFFFSFFFCFRW